MVKRLQALDRIELKNFLHDCIRKLQVDRKLFL